jgi:hypothetical protein
MTLTAYLAQRGTKAKALTKREADLLGIPFPLQGGWARKHGAMIIKEELLPRLAAYADAARHAAEEKARAKRGGAHAAGAIGVQLQLGDASVCRPMSPVPGFVLRRARRFRKPAQSA